MTSLVSIASRRGSRPNEAMKPDVEKRGFSFRYTLLSSTFLGSAESVAPFSAAYRRDVRQRSSELNLEALGNIGDFVGGAAVVATLIYLAVQNRQNTQQVQQSVELARAAAIKAANSTEPSMLAIAQDSELARISSRRSRSPSRVSTAQTSTPLFLKRGRTRLFAHLQPPVRGREQAGWPCGTRNVFDAQRLRTYRRRGRAGIHHSGGRGWKHQQITSVRMGSCACSQDGFLDERRSTIDSLGR